MRKKLSLFIASLAMAFGFSAVGFAPMAFAQDTGNIRCGVNGAFDQEGCADTNDADATVNNSITLVIRILQIIVGIISVIMIIFGGLKYITSGGDSGGVTSAKNTIIYALIGLVVVALAEVIVQFVLNRVDTTA
jgi:hypothetical protein